MEVKTEALQVTGRILKTRTLTDEKKAYIGAMHRFIGEGGEFIVKSTDHAIWIRLGIESEGVLENGFDVYLEGKLTNQFFSDIDGGKLEVKRASNGNIQFSRDQFLFSLKPKTAPGEVRDIEEYIKVAKLKGEYIAAMLKDVIDWCKSYIYTNSSDPSKQVMTIDEKGVAIAGLQDQFVKATGLPGIIKFSLNEDAASTVSAWLGAIKKEKVEVLVTENNQHLIFRELGSKNYIAMTWDDRVCNNLPGDPDIKDLGDELVQIDRAWLVNRLNLISLALGEEQTAIRIELKGQLTPVGSDKAAPASVRLSVDSQNQASDSLPIVRKKSDKPFEIRLDHSQLLHAVEKLDTLNVVFSYSEQYGIVQVENENAKDSGVTIGKRCMIKTLVNKEDEVKKKLKKQSKEETAKVADTM